MKIIDNIKTGKREFYNEHGELVKSYAREVLDDEYFVKEFGEQLFWGCFSPYEYEL